MLLLTLTALAQDAPDEELLATEPAPLLEIARSVTVLDDATLAETMPRTLPEAIEETAGVWVQRSDRGAGAPIIRGLVGAQNLVLVDGLPHTLSTFPAGPGPYFALIDPHAADRVEVIRGSSSVLYGNGAMGGVISVHTLDPPAPDEGRVSELRFILDSTTADVGRGPSVMYRAGSAEKGLLLGVRRAETGALRTGGDALVPLSDLTVNAFRAKGRLTRGAHTLTAAGFGVAIDDAAQTSALGEGEIGLTDTQDLQASLGYAFDGSGVLQRAGVKLGAHRLTESEHRHQCFTDDSGPIDPDACLSLTPTMLADQSLHDDVVSAGLFAADAALGFGERLSVTATAEGQQERIDSTRFDQQPDGAWELADRGNFAPGATYRVAGAALWGDLTAVEAGANRVVVRGGGRLSHFAAHAEDVLLPDDAGDVVAQTVDYANTGLVGGGSLSLVRDRSHLWAGVHQGFRAPTLAESTVPGPGESGFLIPNANLRPERSDTAELGWRHHSPRTTLALVGWGTRIADAIQEAPTTLDGESTSADGLTYSHHTNVEGAQYAGAELEASRTAGPLRVGGHLTATVDATDSGPARRVPPPFGRAFVRATSPRDDAWLELAVRAAGAQTRLSGGDAADLAICGAETGTNLTFADLGEACPGTPGWWTLDIGAHRRINHWLILDIATNNLLDAQYRVHGSGLDAPGRDVRLRLTAQRIRPR